ncbi:MAG: hypothetical protein NZ733_05660 [Aigarchaeota archaeon]|nr:hypothetical protein [Aigarchaeota archaeon]MDW8043288.1 hypothetical protein [Nitrososphaerota archaeon]
MQAKPNMIVTILLAASILVGIIILAFDGLLWFDNPKNGHAYALISFIAVKALLLFGVITAKSWALRGVFYWAITYLLMLLLNPLTGPAIGLSPIEFAL